TGGGDGGRQPGNGKRALAVGVGSGMIRNAERRNPMRRSRLAAAGPALLIAGCGASLIAGCGASPDRQGGLPHASGPPPATQLAPPRATCGTTRPAVNVPVVIEVAKGAPAGPLALRLQDGSTAEVRAGRVPGTGGGAPVRVDGWTCQGEDTPTIVQTGEASECHRGGTQIVAVLNLQAAPSPSGSSG